MTPGPNYILVAPLTTINTTEAGITYHSASATRKGRVLQVGARVNIKMLSGGIREGNTINYFESEANPITFRGDKLALVHIKGVSSID